MLVIGNGESRKQVNLNLIKDIKIGCNAAYRDTRVNYLVAVDKRMLKEAVNAKFHQEAKVFTRKDWWIQYRLEKNLRCVPDIPYPGSDRWDEPWNWGAGPYAVLIASNLDKHQHVRLVGFDLYGCNGKVNNVYKNTENYAVSTKRAVDPSYWIVQIGKIFECFPKVKYTVYNHPDWNLPKQWKKPNVTLDKLDNLV